METPARRLPVLGSICLFPVWCNPAASETHRSCPLLLQILLLSFQPPCVLQFIFHLCRSHLVKIIGFRHQSAQRYHADLSMHPSPDVFLVFRSCVPVFPESDSVSRCFGCFLFLLCSDLRYSCFFHSSPYQNGMSGSSMLQCMFFG